MKRFALALVAFALVLAGCASSSVPWEQEEPLGVTGDSGFRPQVHGFAFQNFTRGPNGLKLSDDDVRQLLGPNACEDDSNIADCQFTERAAAFQYDNQGLQTGGVCEGISVLSARMFNGEDSPTNYGAATAYELELPNNPALESAILRWNASQLTKETVKSLHRDNPEGILNRLNDSFQDGELDYTLGIYNKVDGKLINGHAVVPYAIEHKGEGIVELHIYNSNAPGSDEAIVINTITDTWSYQGANVSYNGSADLEIAPLTARNVDFFSPQILSDFRGAADGPGCNKRGVAVEPID